jgi:hypothetical protein
MSIDKVVRDLVRDEVARIMGPMNSALQEVQAQGAVVKRLAAALGQPVRRSPGRPPKFLALSGGKSKHERRAEADRPCAVQNCKRDARSKGYCAAHYQKLRMLSRTGRLPSDWVEHAEPNTVKNLALPRGRAGSKALAESKKKSKS